MFRPVSTITCRADQFDAGITEGRLLSSGLPARKNITKVVATLRPDGLDSKL
jgi:hypothetical protein